jgi:hypothetical protein
VPTTFQLVETTFPNGEGKDTQEQINGVYDYLFVLLEQLRYTLFNLDGSNINQNALSEFIKNISEPIYAKIEDTDKNVNELSITANGLAGRIGDAEGNIMQLQATAMGLQASISSLDGSVTNLTADVNGLRTTVSGKIDGTAAQTLIDQNLNQITLAAMSGSNGTVFALNKNGVQIASTGTIDLHVKAVNIDGTLTAGALRGNTIALINNNDNTIGGFTLADTSTSTGLGMTTTWGGIKIQPAGNIFLQAGTGGDITIQNGFVQLGSAALCLATPSFGPNKPSGAGVAGQLYIQLVS